MVKLVTPTEEASPGEAAYRATLSKVTAREGVIKTEWLDKTKDIYETYEGGRALDTPFNILYSIQFMAMVILGGIGGYIVVPMNALLQHRGHNLMGAGRSIAVQNFNEQACILGLGAF